MTTLPPALADAAAQLVEARRETMNANDLAVFDLMIALELLRRGVEPRDFHLELRLKAEQHRGRAPYISALMKSMAAHAAPPNVVHLPKPTPTGAKP